MGQKRVHASGFVLVGARTTKYYLCTESFLIKGGGGAVSRFSGVTLTLVVALDWGIS